MRLPCTQSQGYCKMTSKCLNWRIATAVKHEIRTNTNARNKIISNNVVSNKYIVYICVGVTVEDYGKQAFYIRSCYIRRQFY